MDNPASQFLRAPAGSTRSPGDYSPSRTRRPVGDFGLVPKSPPQGAAAPMALAFARCYPASLPWLRGSGLASPRRPAGTFTPFRWDGGSIPPADREVWWRRGESNPDRDYMLFVHRQVTSGRKPVYVGHNSIYTTDARMICRAQAGQAGTPEGKARSRVRPNSAPTNRGQQSCQGIDVARSRTRRSRGGQLRAPKPGRLDARPGMDRIRPAHSRHYPCPRPAARNPHPASPLSRRPASVQHRDRNRVGRSSLTRRHAARQSSVAHQGQGYSVPAASQTSVSPFLVICRVIFRLLFGLRLCRSSLCPYKSHQHFGEVNKGRTQPEGIVCSFLRRQGAGRAGIPASPPRCRAQMCYKPLSLLAWFPASSHLMLF